MSNSINGDDDDFEILDSMIQSCTSNQLTKLDEYKSQDDS